MTRSRWWVGLLVLVAGGCGAKTPLGGAPDDLDVVEEEDAARASAGASGASGQAGAGGSGLPAGPIEEVCYKPDSAGAPPSPCVQIGDKRLPSLFEDCPDPAIIESGPITDINITLGTTRCCYEISTETCKFLR